MKTRVYIAGPITGYKNDNREAFEAGAKRVESWNCEAVSPINNKPRTQNNAPPLWEDYMRMGIVQLMGCDEIYLLKGWESSKGAVIEHQLATALGMKQHFE